MKEESILQVRRISYLVCTYWVQKLAGLWFNFTDLVCVCKCAEDADSLKRCSLIERRLSPWRHPRRQRS